ncbi:MAG: DNA polymerase III subunit epsilon [Myxococcaceae bacterium]|nr:MAG: DNA polymerase III subunit epsilon [Myxococcaceae bacterium]
MARFAKARFALVLVGSQALAIVAAALVGAGVWAALGPEERSALAAGVMERGPLLVGLGIGLLAGYGLLVWVLVQQHLAAPLALAQGTRLITHGNASHRLEPLGGAELRELADAINALAAEHETLGGELEARVAEAQQRLGEERDRLAAIVAEASQAVLVCNLEGRILLYNLKARELHGRATDGTSPDGGAGLVGLARSVFVILERALVAHALETIQARLEKGAQRPVASFVTAGGGRLLRVHVSPVLRGGRATQEASDPAPRGAGTSAITGFVLRIDDVTRPLQAGSRTEAALQALTDASRRALANIRAAVETLLAHPGLEAERRAAFVGVIHDEASALSATLDRAAPELTSLRAEWLLENMQGADLLSAARSRIEGTLGLSTTLDEIDPGLWLKVESYSLVRAVVSIGSRLQRRGVRELRLALRPAGRRAHLDVTWSGADVPTEIIARWEDDPPDVDGEPMAPTLRAVVERHDGAVWSQGDRPSGPGFIRLVLPVAEAEQAPLASPVTRGRPEFYDFDLFHQPGQTPELDERKLTALEFTAFDTETTGLNPSDGDEIIAIGAVRIVNGRLLHQEAFEQFVDPGRPVSQETVRITGIDPALLRDKPPIEEVLPRFHRFCEGTVLVAHNGAFDLRFLQLKEAVAGVRFAHPVLDTLLLAELIQPDLPPTGLEGIAERFGVPVLGRHTALGDAIMTGEIFLRMVPLLRARGIETLREAREASQRTWAARLEY